MREILIIGDVHGKLNGFAGIMLDEKPRFSIQLGDFGFKKHHDWFLGNMDTSRHRILFGNHDYYPYLDKPYSLGDFHEQVLPSGRKLFCVRGAWSIDQMQRIQGIDWFPEEEMDIMRWNECITAYERFKPDMVISHDCPYSIYREFFSIHQPNRTCMGLDTLLDIHPPGKWIFGHHHKPRTESFRECEFTCLGELQATWL